MEKKYGIKYVYIKRYEIVGQIIWSKSDIGIHKIVFITKSGENKTEIFIEEEFKIIEDKIWLSQLEPIIDLNKIYD